MTIHFKKSLLVASIMGCLTACGGGGDTTNGTGTESSSQNSGSSTTTNDTPSATTSRKGVTEGVITKKEGDSVTVSGTQFKIAKATISSNGKEGTQSDLDVGKQVTVNADYDENGEASATSIDYESSLVGPISSIDTENNVIVVLNQQIEIKTDTVLDGTTFADLKVNQLVDVSGMINSSDRLEAGYVATLEESEEHILTGKVTDLDASAMTFKINGLLVNYGQAENANGLGQELTNDDLVFIVGTLNDIDGSPVFMATEVEEEEAFTGDEGLLVEIPGFITKALENNQFEIEGLKINIDDDTEFVYGDPSLLVLDAYVEVEGEIEDGMINAKYLMVEPENEVAVFAAIEAIDLDNQTFTVLGQTFKVNDRTLMTSFEFDEASDEYEEDFSDDDFSEDFSGEDMDSFTECEFDFDEWEEEGLDEEFLDDDSSNEEHSNEESEDELNEDFSNEEFDDELDEEEWENDFADEVIACEDYEEMDDFELDEEWSSLSLSDLKVGEHVEVVAYPSAESVLVSTFVARVPSEELNEVFVSAPVDNVDSENRTISVLGKTIDLSAGDIEIYVVETFSGYDDEMCEELLEECWDEYDEYNANDSDMCEEDASEDCSDDVNDEAGSAESEGDEAESEAAEGDEAEGDEISEDDSSADDQAYQISVEEFFANVNSGDYLFLEGENNDGTVAWRAIGVEVLVEE